MRTPALLLAGVLLAVIAVLSVGFGVLELTQIRASRPVVGSGAAIIMLGYGVFLLAVARGVLRGRRWSRAPGVATQLLQLPIAWSFRGGETAWFAVALGAVSLCVLVCLLLPSSTAVFVPEASRPVDVEPSPGSGPPPEAGRPPRSG